MSAAKTCCSESSFSRASVSSEVALPLRNRRASSLRCRAHSCSCWARAIAAAFSREALIFALIFAVRASSFSFRSLSFSSFLGSTGRSFAFRTESLVDTESGTGGSDCARESAVSPGMFRCAESAGVSVSFPAGTGGGAGADAGGGACPSGSVGIGGRPGPFVAGRTAALSAAGNGAGVSAASESAVFCVGTESLRKRFSV